MSFNINPSGVNPGALGADSTGYGTFDGGSFGTFGNSTVPGFDGGGYAGWGSMGDFAGVIVSGSVDAPYVGALIQIVW
ncbi:hypothetical protein [Nocardia sp. NPDC127526]|uniref:hypothetical protein n=1 Tax=Nocardia sp. NPDC127526 TaxID=3345393 RepID=UPI00363A9837